MLLSISGFRWAEPFEIWNLPRGGIVHVLSTMGTPLAWLLALVRATQRDEGYQSLMLYALVTLHQCQCSTGHTSQRR